MKLTDLEPRFMRYETRIATWTRWQAGGVAEQVTGPQQWSISVSTLAEAQGLRFLCPKCSVDNIQTLDRRAPAAGRAGARLGVHQCTVSFEGRGVLPAQGSHNSEGEPVRWTVSGDSFENLTTTPSILIVGGCGWHGFITAGEITP